MNVPAVMHRIFLTLLLTGTLSVTTAVPVTAGCVSDCRDDYESEIERCKVLYDDPDDADDLQTCIGNARSECEDCVDECHS